MRTFFYGIKTAPNLLSTTVQKGLPKNFNFIGRFVGIFSFKSNNPNNINILPKIFYPVGDAK